MCISQKLQKCSGMNALDFSSHLLSNKSLHRSYFISKLLVGEIFPSPRLRFHPVHLNLFLSSGSFFFFSISLSRVIFKISLPAIFLFSANMHVKLHRKKLPLHPTPPTDSLAFLAKHLEIVDSFSPLPCLP